MRPVINPKDAGFNEALRHQDLLSPILPFIKKGAFYVTESGKVRATTEGIEPDTPWIHVRTDPNKDCGMWHSIMFDCYRFIPSPCFECWKVVVSPRSLKELFQVLKIQKEMWEGPCKCGIEIRDYTPRLYGAYFYNRSLDEGQDTWWKVKKLVADHVSPAVNVILKRGCTEFEMLIGPSNNWQLQPGQLEKEEAIYAMFDKRDFAMAEQDQSLHPRVMRAWIQWAYKHGDNTYLEYNGGIPLYHETIKYHDVDLSKLEKTEMEMVTHQ